jgi:hypothetical protein
MIMGSERRTPYTIFPAAGEPVVRTGGGFSAAKVITDDAKEEWSLSDARRPPA